MTGHGQKLRPCFEWDLPTSVSFACKSIGDLGGEPQCLKYFRVGFFLALEKVSGISSLRELLVGIVDDAVRGTFGLKS